MSGQIYQMLADYSGIFGIIFAVFLRVGAAMAFIPGFGENTVSIRVRLVLTLAFTAIVWPIVVHTQRLEAVTFQPRMLLTETIAGLAMGAFFRLFVLILQVTGTIAAQATSLSQIFGGAGTPEPLPVFGNILVISGLALAMGAGLHVKLALALAQSYDAFPLGHLPAPTDITEWGVSGVSGAFATAFSLAAPFLILSVCYNLAIGFINRAMPQLMVSFVGAPAITFGGLVILAIAAPIILVLWLQRFNQGLSNPFGAWF